MNRHAEISGTGVEIGGIGGIKVDLIEGKCGGWPITETADAYIRTARRPVTWTSR